MYLWQHSIHTVLKHLYKITVRICIIHVIFEPTCLSNIDQQHNPVSLQTSTLACFDVLTSRNL